MKRFCARPKLSTVRAVGFLVAALTLALPAAFSHAQTPPTCVGFQATNDANGNPLIGTEGIDRLVGTEGNDVIIGLGGDDQIEGLGGNDLICGDDDDPATADGRDQIEGGPGDDDLVGNGDRDQLRGGDGNDNACGDACPQRPAGARAFTPFPTAASTPGPGDDQIEGGPGADGVRNSNVTIVNGVTDPASLGDEPTDAIPFGLHGDDRKDQVKGGDGDDRNLFGGDENDQVVGGDGNDGNLVGELGDDSVDGGPGNDDLLEGGPGNDQVAGGDGDDSLLEQAGDDKLDGGPGADKLFDNNPFDVNDADVLVGGLGPDRLFAQDGDALDRLDGGVDPPPDASVDRCDSDAGDEVRNCEA